MFLRSRSSNRPSTKVLCSHFSPLYSVPSFTSSMCGVCWLRKDDPLRVTVTPSKEAPKLRPVNNELPPPLDDWGTVKVERPVQVYWSLSRVSLYPQVPTFDSLTTHVFTTVDSTMFPLLMVVAIVVDDVAWSFSNGRRTGSTRYKFWLFLTSHFFTVFCLEETRSWSQVSGNYRKRGRPTTETKGDCVIRNL